MPAYLILGPSGSGKTTIGEYLRGRGYEVIETDNILGAYYNRSTGKKTHERPTLPISQDWLATYAWNWDGEKLESLLEENKNKTVFFCGGADNESSYFKRFTLRFALSIDNQTLVKRLQKREPNRWIDGSIELMKQLEWNEKFRDYGEQIGAVIIDTAQPPDKVADQIEEIISKYASK